MGGREVDDNVHSFHDAVRMAFPSHVSTHETSVATTCVDTSQVVAFPQFLAKHLPYQTARTRD